MNYLIGIALGIIAFIGVSFVQPQSTNYDGKHPSEDMLVGATSFPSSLDSLTNPGATDSVATVSHSGQHANANDAIEALEAKIGIGVSTPLADTIFGGLSTGVSGWFSWATSTRMTAQNLVITASSTIQDFTARDFVARNATTTNATSTGSIATTNIIATNIASTSQFYANNLTTCSGSNFLQWTGGVFGCGAVSAGLSTFSTTTSVNLATTTITSALIPSTDELEITLVASTTGSFSGRLKMTFNGDYASGVTRYADNATINGGATSGNSANSFITIQPLTGGNKNFLIQMKIYNGTDAIKQGTYSVGAVSTSTSPTTQGHVTGSFFYSSLSRITQIDLEPDNDGADVRIGQRTTFRISGY